RAVDSDRGVYLYASSTRESKGFFVLIDPAAIESGLFDSKVPEKLEQNWLNKRIRVIGRIVKNGDNGRAYRSGALFIKVFDPKQIQVLDERAK
ncbi:MAG: hypothetical protein K8T89_17280, partial [Planctomycetes bacterium]|nr:hypothetical protein [Planctomycetota bacterium]